jgi:hypothetical protein
MFAEPYCIFDPSLTQSSPRARDFRTLVGYFWNGAAELELLNNATSLRTSSSVAVAPSCRLRSCASRVVWTADVDSLPWSRIPIGPDYT